MKKHNYSPLFSLSNRPPCYMCLQVSYEVVSLTWCTLLDNLLHLSSKIQRFVSWQLPSLGKTIQPHQLGPLKKFISIDDLWHLQFVYLDCKHCIFPGFKISFLQQIQLIRLHNFTSWRNQRLRNVVWTNRQRTLSKNMHQLHSAVCCSLQHNNTFLSSVLVTR
jgi:hypothetical protein